MRCRTSRRLDGLELGYLAAALTVGGSAWLALLLAELGLFFGLVGALAALAGGAGAAAWVLRDVAGRVPIARPAPVLLGAGVGLALLAAAVLGRPHEYVLGGLDPGVYVDTAAHIARSGSIVWWDRDLMALSAPARAALFREMPGRFTEGSRLIGFYLGGLEQGRVVPHGMHLLPAAMAIGYALAGLPGLFLVPPLLALVAIGGLALLARRWAGDAAGAIAALLMTFNAAETWFGRYPAAELLVQLGLFAGLLALAVALSADSPWLGLAAGGLVGLAHLAKIDTVALPVAVMTVFGYCWLSDRLGPVHRAFAAGYLFMLIHALVHAGTIATQYTYSVYSRSLPGPSVLVPLVAGGLFALGLVVWLRRHGQLGGGPLAAIEARRDLLWLAAAGAVVALGAYGWYLRPLDPWRELVGLPEPLAMVVRNRLHALPRLAWFVPPLAVLLAFVGYLAAVRRLPGAAAGLLLAMLPIEAIVVLAEPRITPEYPWAARRWVAVLIPSIVLLASLQLGWLWPRRLHPSALRRAAFGRLAGAVLPTGLALALVAASAGQSAPLLGHREFGGSGELVGRIAAAVEPDGVVLFDDDLIGWRLAAPLNLIDGRTSFVLFNHAADDEAVATPLAEWERSGRPVYWLRVGDPRPFVRWARDWRPVQRWQTGLREVRATTETPPTRTQTFDVPITLYSAAVR